jgi:hypothetical protein
MGCMGRKEKKGCTKEVLQPLWGGVVSPLSSILYFLFSLWVLMPIYICECIRQKYWRGPALTGMAGGKEERNWWEMAVLQVVPYGGHGGLKPTNCIPNTLNLPHITPLPFFFDLQMYHNALTIHSHRKEKESRQAGGKYHQQLRKHSQEEPIICLWLAMVEEGARYLFWRTTTIADRMAT